MDAYIVIVAVISTLYTLACLLKGVSTTVYTAGWVVITVILTLGYKILEGNI